MKVSTQEIEQRQMVLDVEVDEERVQRALEQAYQRIVRRLNVPGFRRGRAPRPLVERMVGREAMLEDAVEHLVPEVYRDALREHQIEAAGQPSVEVTSTEPLQFRATVPLQPAVELGDYHSIQIALGTAEVEDAEVDAVVENLRESHATWAPVDRAVQIGDRVGLDAKATQGERVIMDSHDAEFVVDPEGPEPAPGFSQQLVGLSAGQERTFTLAQPSASDQDEAAPPLDFRVSIHWVKQKQLPALDDEFARAVAEQESVDSLMSEVRGQIQRRKEEQARDQQRESIIQAAVDQARVDVPPQTIEREAHQLLSSMAASLDKQGMSIEQYLRFTGKDESTFKSELLAEAERSLKRSLVLEAVAEAEDLDVADQEVREEIERASQSSSDPARTAREAFERAETRARVASIIRTRKGLLRLLKLAGGADSEEPAAASSTTVSESTGEGHD